MASIPVVINGATGDGQPITIIGSMAYADRGVGGGPIPPGGGGGPVDPGYGVPERPVDPGYFPPVPTHPIVLPPGGERPPIDPPIEPPTNPPNPHWQWVWVPTGDGGGRWTPGYVPGPSDPSPH